MTCCSRALASARRAQQTLFFCRAVDFSEQVGNAGRDVYARALQVPSVAQTGLLPGVLLLRIGMWVRMTTQMLAPWVVQGTFGVIMEIHGALADMQKLQRQPIENAQSVSKMLLAELPVAVFAKLDETTLEFMPPRVCEKHGVSGFAQDCDACREFSGWVLVEPNAKSWTFSDLGTGAEIKVTRSQLPLMPAEACPLYGVGMVSRK